MATIDDAICFCKSIISRPVALAGACCESATDCCFICRADLPHLVAQCAGLEQQDGTTAQFWVNCKGGLQIFAVHSWHSEGWTERNEALMEAVMLRTRDAVPMADGV